MESHARSIAKAVTYRLFGSLATAGIFYALSGNWQLSAGAGALDVVSKITLYFLHERLWNHIPFGKPRDIPPPEYEI